MQLSQIRIINYRNFLDTTVSFKEGVNIVIGPNNAGKTNLLKVINLLARRERKLLVEDFNYNDLFDNSAKYTNIPPKIEFHYIIEHSFNPDEDEVDNAIIKLKNFIVYSDDGDLFQETTEFYKIKGSFKIIFELNDKYFAEYKKQMSEIDKDLEPLAYFEEFKNKLETLIDKYEWGYYNEIGDDIHSSQSDIKDIFNIDFIPADRTTDKLLPETKKFIKQKIDENETNKFEVNRDISNLINTQLSPISEDVESLYKADQDKIGIGKGNNKIASGFRFDGSLEKHFYFSLIDKNKGYSLPLENNGLGHNNLIQIYNIIKFKVYDDYNILLIEEPEAHLHPAMQYQLFSYLQTLESVSIEKIKNQIIITTHSPNISASSNIDDLISIHYYNQKSDCCVDTENLGEKFILKAVPKGITEDPNKLKERLTKAKSHLVKFLDITRSDMLFTEKTILVEGLAEKLLIPLFAKKESIDLIENHISIVEVGGINFNHFLPIFKNTKSKCLCIRDCDYSYIDENGNININNYPTHLAEAELKLIHDLYKKELSIKAITQQNLGSTFENELFIDNFADDDLDPDLETVCKKLLSFVLPEAVLTTSLKNQLSLEYWNENIDEIEKAGTKNKISNELMRYLELYNASDEKTKKIVSRLFFANLFLLYATNKKGDLALKIWMDTSIHEKLITPEYIKVGLQWIK